MAQQGAELDRELGGRLAAAAHEGEGHAAGAHAHEWETSPWPLTVSVGILLALPLAFTFKFVYGQPLLAVIMLGLGTPLIVAGVVGWIREGLGAHELGLSPAAMPWFILAEALIFLSLFASYWVMRLGAPEWPPAGTVDLPRLVPLVMTVILVSSSFTIHAAEARLAEGRHGAFLRWLVLTMVLGTVFVLLSAFEWRELIHEGFTPATNAYSTAFFSITGFHAAHVVVGLGAFLALLLPALGGRISEPFVKSASMYWHFVDIVWLFVVSQVYFW